MKERFVKLVALFGVSAIFVFSQGMSVLAEGEVAGNTVEETVETEQVEEEATEEETTQEEAVEEEVTEGEAAGEEAAEGEVVEEEATKDEATEGEAVDEEVTIEDAEEEKVPEDVSEAAILEETEEIAAESVQTYSSIAIDVSYGSNNPYAIYVDGGLFQFSPNISVSGADKVYWTYACYKDGVSEAVKEDLFPWSVNEGEECSVHAEVSGLDKSGDYFFELYFYTPEQVDVGRGKIKDGEKPICTHKSLSYSLDAENGTYRVMDDWHEAVSVEGVYWEKLSDMENGCVCIDLRSFESNSGRLTCEAELCKTDGTVVDKFSTMDLTTGSLSFGTNIYYFDRIRESGSGDYIVKVHFYYDGKEIEDKYQETEVLHYDGGHGALDTPQVEWKDEEAGTFQWESILNAGKYEAYIYQVTDSGEIYKTMYIYGAGKTEGALSDFDLNESGQYRLELRACFLGLYYLDSETTQLVFDYKTSSEPEKPDTPEQPSTPSTPSTGGSGSHSSGSGSSGGGSSQSAAAVRDPNAPATSLAVAVPGQAVAPAVVRVIIPAADGTNRNTSLTLENAVAETKNRIVAAASAAASSLEQMIATVQTMMTAPTPHFTQTVAAVAQMKGSNIVINNMGTVKTAAVATDSFGNTIASAGKVKNVTGGALILVMGVHADGTVEYVEGFVDPVTGAVVSVFEETPVTITVLVIA